MQSLSLVAQRVEKVHRSARGSLHPRVGTCSPREMRGEDGYSQKRGDSPSTPRLFDGEKVPTGG